MGQQPDIESAERPCTVSIQNMGGISERTVSVPPGVSMLVGRNATNRSSFLRSLATALGADETAGHPKTDEDHGTVQLEVDGNEYSRTLERGPTGIRTEGTPYVDDPELVDAFVCLFPESPVRRALRDGADLREVLMRPVDTVAIRDRIRELKRLKEDLTGTIDRIEEEETNLPRLEQSRQELESELAAVDEEIATLQKEASRLRDQTEIDESEESTALRERLEDLRDEMNGVERRIDATESQLDHRRSQREDLEREREKLAEAVDQFDDAEALEREIRERDREIERLEDRRDTMERLVEDLQSVIRVNQSFLDDDHARQRLATSGDLTSALDPNGQTVNCWTCGTDVETNQISDRLETLQNLVADHRSDVRDIEAELSTLRSEKRSCKEKLDSYRRNERRFEELDSRIEQHDRKIEELEDTLGTHRDEADRLDDEIAAVEADLQALDTDDEETGEFIATHQELTSLERERGRLEARLSKVTDEIERVESLAAEREEAEGELESVRTELHELRDKIQTIEQQLIETLNGVMEDLIDRLQYENIERVWFERLQEGNDESRFSLHIVRAAEDGSVYEDTVDTLSESERAVLGIVASLVGYIVHDVDGEVPFLLIDSVEMIDGERLARLLEYITSETDLTYLVVALLPKDARAVRSADALTSPTTLQFGTGSD